MTSLALILDFTTARKGWYAGSTRLVYLLPESIISPPLWNVEAGYLIIVPPMPIPCNRETSVTENERAKANIINPP